MRRIILFAVIVFIFAGINNMYAQDTELIVEGEIRAELYEDQDDPTNYFMNFNGVSWINRLNIGPNMHTKVGGIFDKAILHVGGGCEYDASIYGGTDQPNYRAIFGFNRAASGSQSFGVVGQTQSSTDGVAGIYGQALATSGLTYGILGVNKSSSSNATAVLGYQEAITGLTYGVKGENESATNEACGVYGRAKKTTGATNGVRGITNSETDWAAGVYGIAYGQTGVTDGVRGWNTSTSNDASGVYGIANAATGATNGVKGLNNSTSNNACGVYGVTAAASGATIGVKGVTNSNSNWCAGVYGYAGGATAETYGVKGEVLSPNGYSGVFSGGKGIYLNGNLNMTSDKKIYIGGVQAEPDDLAEDIKADGCEAGDVVVVDPDNDRSVVKSSKPYSNNVAGIISENPTLYIGKREGEKPLALAGQVRCKATTENGPIKRGDILVTSSKPGYAMKGNADEVKYGMIVGKALEPLEDGEGKILILVE